MNLMNDVKEKVNAVVDKVKNDPAFMKSFQNDPIKAVEGVLGVDLPDDVIKNVVDGVKAKITGDKLSGALGSILGKK